MADIKLADVTVHIDETLSAAERAQVEQDLRAMEGVVSVHMPSDKPHLAVVTFDPDHAKSNDILKSVLGEHLHAELIGL